MKKFFRQLGALVLCVGLILSFHSPIRAEAQQNGDSSKDFPVHVIHKPGDDRDNYVILILGDGYTADQQGKFLEDATNAARGMLQWSPYKEHSDRINIYAIEAVSQESGLSDYWEGIKKKTYFEVGAVGSGLSFTSKGRDNAEALKNMLKKTYLDGDAFVDTIHILSNYSGNFGGSISAFFSFSTASAANSNGDVMTHELAHSIGKLGDEYGKNTKCTNVSSSSNADDVDWKELLGFGGVGIAQAGNSSAFAPSTECMMRETGRDFCEFCKLQLSYYLCDNNGARRPKGIYVANPELTLEHNRIATVGSKIKDYRITEKNITKAKGKTLEFRTIVQNQENQARNLKISLRIISSDGARVKYENQQQYTINALENSFWPENARKSISVTLEGLDDLTQGDKIEGQIIDEDTREVLATDKSSVQKWGRVNIHYKLKSDMKDIPNTQVATVYVPVNTRYTLSNPGLHGYTCIGNSADSSSVMIEGANTDITYYYEKAPTKETTALSLSATPQVLSGGGEVTLQVTRDNIPEDQEITVSCDKSEIVVTKQDNDRWLAILPNVNEEYTFTAHYAGSESLLDSASSCTVRVEQKHEESDENKPGNNNPGGVDSNPGGSGSGGSSGSVDSNPGHNKPEDNKPEDGGNKPGDNKPEDNKPEDNKPEDNKPEDGGNKPGDDKTEDNKPEDNKPEDNKPEDGGNKPEDNKPCSHNKISKTVIKATKSKDGKIVHSCSKCKVTISTTVISRVSRISLNFTSLAYTGNALKPAVKVYDCNNRALSSGDYTVTYKNNVNPGTGSAIVSLRGNYSGTLSANFVINLRNVTRLSTTGKSKSLLVKWDKITNVTGYQIQYSLKSNMKSAKTLNIPKNKTVSTTISKLKAKKRYYVRIRTYKTIGKTRVYSQWSKASSVKTK